MHNFALSTNDLEEPSGKLKHTVRECESTERKISSSWGQFHVMADEAEPNASRTALISAWVERCATAGVDPEHCSRPEGRSLVRALCGALGHGAQTPELGRATRKWGARFFAPAEALAALTALREAVFEANTHDDTAQRLPVADRDINRVVDQVMLEAVDAAAANLRAQARTDPLTGCANRLALNEDLARSAGSASRSGLDLALAAIDLDGLKRINDTQGHAAGDAALQALVARLREQLRDADTLYRTGGDEFVVVAPFTDTAGAAAMLERASEGDGPSFSWGVASMRALGAKTEENPELLIAAADTALYEKRRDSRAKAERDSSESKSLPMPPAWTRPRPLLNRQRAALALLGSTAATLARRETVALASVRSRAAAMAQREGAVLGSAALSARKSASEHRKLIGLVAAAVLLTAGVIGGLAADLGQATGSNLGKIASVTLPPDRGSRQPSEQGPPTGASTGTPTTAPVTTEVPSASGSSTSSSGLGSTSALSALSGAFAAQARPTVAAARSSSPASVVPSFSGAAGIKILSATSTGLHADTVAPPSSPAPPATTPRSDVGQSRAPPGPPGRSESPGEVPTAHGNGKFGYLPNRDTSGSHRDASGPHR